MADKVCFGKNNFQYYFLHGREWKGKTKLLYIMTLSLKDRQKAHIKKAYNFLRGQMVDQFDGKTSCANSKGSI